MSGAHEPRVRVLLVWEDQYCEKLHLLLKRSVRHCCAKARVEFVRDSSRGNSNFAAYVQQDWPKARQHGFAREPKVDYIVCVADADCVSTVCPTAGTPPDYYQGAQALETWMSSADVQWTKTLRTATTLDPDRVHGRFLRWSKESVVTACFDVPEALGKLGNFDQEKLRRHLAQCRPHRADSSPDEMHIHEVRSPQSCLERGCASVDLAVPRKSSVVIDDVIDAASKTHIAKLVARLPDLRMLSHFVAELAQAHERC